MSRKYLQYNDLVIDSYNMLESADLSIRFKQEEFEYSFAHGSYAPTKGNNSLVQAQNLSMTLMIDSRKLSCEQRDLYKDHVLYNLTRDGRLWAVEGERLLWTFAKVTDYSETYTANRYDISIDVNFLLYEGVWHKADILKVFLRPYNLCDFLDCQDFRPAQNCLDYCEDTCAVCLRPKTKTCEACNCHCQVEENDLSFCSGAKQAIRSFYSTCNGDYKILYSCEGGLKHWGREQFLGTKLCKQDICSGLIAGRFYSDTILETDQLTITIDGKLKNPLLTINGNILRINGEYDGTLTIYEDYTVTYKYGDCCEEIIVDQSNVIIPIGAKYGFTIHHGDNTFMLETNDCCSMACAFLKVDAITT